MTSAALLVLSPFLLLVAGRTLQYCVLGALGRLPHDQAMAARKQKDALKLGGTHLLQVFAWSMAPIANVLVRCRVSPSLLTISCFLGSVVSAVLLAKGLVPLGGAVGLLSAGLDYFDGQVARRLGTDSAAGSYLDSSLDRCGELAWFSGAALLFREDALLLLACLVTMSTSVVISYTRAKAESLGYALRGGLIQRPQRVLLFCGGALSCEVLDRLLPTARQDAHGIFAGALVLLAALSTWTAASRLISGYHGLKRKDAS